MGYVTAKPSGGQLFSLIVEYPSFHHPEETAMTRTRFAAILLILCCFTLPLHAGQGDKRSFRASDTLSIDGIIKALYGVISGPAGSARDWTRFRSLFHKSALLVPVNWTGDSRFEVRPMPVDDYVKKAAQFLESRSFYEHEIARRSETFCQIAQVFSTYVVLKSPDDPLPERRGINSLQLYHDGRRWWIMHILWDDERAGSTIPERYLY